MKRVLISSANLRNGNGIASCMMNYYDGLLSAGYQVDFILLNDVPSQHMEYVKSHGGNIYIYPLNTGKPNKRNYLFVKKVLKNGNYHIIHNNLTGFNGTSFLREAKIAGIKNRIHHSHNPLESSSIKSRVRSFIYDPMCARLSTCGLACSSLAGNDVFGTKKYIILPNAIYPDLYSYDEDYRNTFRNQYQLENKFVIGTICRQAEQKNPYFIIDVFEEILKKNKEAHLIWVGSGPLMDSIKNYIDNKGLTKNILLLGARTDANKIYSAMDVFFLPSFFEGLGLVFIEAQVSGLQCFASDRVPRDTAVTKNIKYISLKKNAEYWAKMILTSKTINTYRGNYSEYLKVKGYDLHCCGGHLSKIYDNLIS